MIDLDVDPPPEEIAAKGFAAGTAKFRDMFRRENDSKSLAQIDAIAIAAGIVARWTGGPMHQANRRGLLLLRRDLRLLPGHGGRSVGQVQRYPRPAAAGSRRPAGRLTARACAATRN